MNRIWVALIVFCVLFGVLTGRGEALSAALLASGGEAVKLCITLAGAYILWCGVLSVMEKSGLVGKLARLIRPVFRLFPGIEPQSAAGSAIATNLAANMLGLGNAATPAGIEAMKEMRRLSPRSDRPSDAMCMFLVINSSSIQLIPTTVLSLRAAAGSANAGDIILPALLATACSTLFAVLAMRLWIGLERKGEGDALLSRDGGRAAARRSRDRLRSAARRSGL